MSRLPCACLCASATAVIIGDDACKSLHLWDAGAFGELLVVDAATGALCDRKAGFPSVLLLRLHAVEVFYLAFGVRPPRLTVARPPENPADDYSVSSDANIFNVLPMLASAADAPLLSERECWDALVAGGQPNLPYLYAAYVALRSAGWVIRDGIKFGVHFALYTSTTAKKQHAQLHALVFTQEESEKLWIWLQRHARVSHGVGKGLLLCCVASGPTAAACKHSGLGPEQVEALNVRTLRIDGWHPDRMHALAP